MPYFIYKIFPGKQLEPVTEIEKFQEAKQQARHMREVMSADEDYAVKIIFAKNSIEAQLLLKEQREARPQGDD